MMFGRVRISRDADVWQLAPHAATWANWAFYPSNYGAEAGGIRPTCYNRIRPNVVESMTGPYPGFFNRGG